MTAVVVVTPEPDVAVVASEAPPTVVLVTTDDATSAVVVKPTPELVLVASFMPTEVAIVLPTLPDVVIVTTEPAVAVVTKEEPPTVVVVEAIRGPQGASGATGPQGPSGAVGGFGPQGVPGPQGVAGVQGSQGVIGVTGPQGARGTQGLQGVPGVQGPQGDAGPQGARGAQGPQGEIGVGVAGAQGAQGRAGPQGPVGATGSQGPAGVAGPQGTAGPQGSVGVGSTGPQGPQGVPGVGVQGPQGVAGELGPQGVAGPQGVMGSVGPTGPQGPAGAGAAGPQGAAGVQGPPGAQGPAGAGAQGPQGVAGAQGAQGPAGGGPQGPQGAAGAQGTAGVQGPQGVAGGGPQGPQGAPGRFIISSTAPPLASSTHGDAWWDQDDGMSYICYDDGTSKQWVSFIGPQGPQGAPGSGGSGGGTSVSIGVTPPVTPAAGDLWWKSDDGTLKIRYDDGNTQQWVDAVTGTVGAQGPPGVQGAQGPPGTGAQGPQGVNGTGVPGGATTQLQYNNAGAFAGTANIRINEVSKRINFFDAIDVVANDFYARLDKNGQFGVFFHNNQAGTAAKTAICAFNNSPTYLGMFKYSTIYTTAGLEAADAGILCNSSGSMVIENAANAPIIVTIGGLATANERLRIDNTGISVNQSTSNSPALISAQCADANVNARPEIRLYTTGYNGSTNYHQIYSCWNGASGGIPQYDFVIACDPTGGVAVGNLSLVSTPSNSGNGGIKMYTGGKATTNLHGWMDQTGKATWGCGAGANVVIGGPENYIFTNNQNARHVVAVNQGTNGTTAYCGFTHLHNGTGVCDFTSTPSGWTAQGLFLPSQTNLSAGLVNGININAYHASGAINLSAGGSALANIKVRIDPTLGMVIKPPATATPANNGELTVEATSNTSLTFRLKGSDGVVRSGTMTLS